MPRLNISSLPTRQAVVLAACAALLLGGSADAGPRSTNDPLRPLQWGLDHVHAEQAWNVTRGRGAVVAVIDTGVLTTHPDLRGQLLPGINLYEPGRPVTDDSGHGTEVAGVIGARAGNGEGIAGIAPEARILPVKIGEGMYVDGNLAAPAVDWAVAHGADVINMSFASLPLTGEAAGTVLPIYEELQAALDRAWASGVVVVGGAGNSIYPLCSPPASLRHVVCVGAVDEQRTRAYYSQGDATGRSTYLVAPGGSSGETSDRRGIWTTSVPAKGGTSVGVGQPSKNPTFYAQTSGTSFAAPVVSAVAALLSTRGLSNEQIVQRLVSTATDLGPAGRDPIYGHGEVDAGRALRP